MLETPFFISELIAAQIGSPRTSSQVHVSISNDPSDSPITNLVSDECLVVPKTHPLTPSRTSSFHAQSSDPQINGLNNNVSLLMPTSQSVPEMTHTSTIPSPAASVTTDSSPVGSDTELSEWPGDFFLDFQELNTISVYPSSVQETSACPDSPTHGSDTSEPQNVIHSVLETQTSQLDSTPFNGTSTSSKMSERSYDVSIQQTPPLTQKFDSSTPSSPIPKTYDSPSGAPEFLLNTSQILRPITPSVSPSPGLIVKGASTQSSTENLSPEYLENAHLSPPLTDQTRPSSSLSEETGSVLSRNNSFRSSSASCFISSL